MDVRRYVTEAGKDVFGEWMSALSDARAVAKVLTRVNRLAVGNFGDCKSLGQGVRELRIDYGPGYRVYFATIGKNVILLLCAGDKRRQASDIERAVKYLKDFVRRTKSHET